MLTTILILTIIMLIIALGGTYVAIRAFIQYKREKLFNRQSVFLQTIGTYLAIILTALSLYLAAESIESSTQSTNEMVNNLKNIFSSTNNVKNSLDLFGNKVAELPSKLDSFSIVINRMNEIITQQQENFINTIERLNTTVVILENKLEKYKVAVGEYGDNLEQMSKLTDKYLKVWKDRMELELKEKNKEPKFLLAPSSVTINDSIIFLDKISVLNYGNMGSNMQTLFLTIPRSIFKDIKSYNRMVIKKFEDDNIVDYQINYDNFHINELSPQELDLRITLKNVKNTKSIIKYQINQENQNDRLPRFGEFDVRIEYTKLLNEFLNNLLKKK